MNSTIIDRHQITVVAADSMSYTRVWVSSARPELSAGSITPPQVAGDRFRVADLHSSVQWHLDAQQDQHDHPGLKRITATNRNRFP
jgi:hypothetical protein